MITLGGGTKTLTAGYGGSSSHSNCTYYCQMGQESIVGLIHIIMIEQQSQPQPSLSQDHVTKTLTQQLQQPMKNSAQ